ncbi:MAG: hypothetical protein HXY18_12585 [Bryobacteraceae bacterium]|nr:hypothetical protein [Bryobacteraceae bacterium]
MELARRLQLKPGASIRVVNMPKGIVLELPVQPKSKNILLFAASRLDLARHAPVILAKATDEDLIWIAFPKKSGPIQTDIGRDHGWEPVTEAGWQGVRLIAIDETWSAMRVRPAKR